MSEVKTNKISPVSASGTIQFGDSGDTFTIPSGATFTNSGTSTGFGMDSTDQAACKAWIRFDGTGTIAIDDDYNVDSLTDHGTGLYTMTFTSALAANYAAVGSAGDDADPADCRVYMGVNSGYSTTAHKLNIRNDANQAEDVPVICVICFGD